MFQALGWVGMILALVTYWMVTTKRITVERMFHALNLVAVTFLGLAAWDTKTYPIVVLEIVWGCIALYGLLQRQTREP